MRRYKIALFINSTIDDLKAWLKTQDPFKVFTEQGFTYSQFVVCDANYIKFWVESGVNVIRLTANGSETIDCSNLKSELNKMLKTLGSGKAYIVRIEIDDADGKRYFTDPKE